ncbi:DUF1073 domain-containing protein [Paraburkholderia tuberum]|uniref:Anti-CBASS protein Acb1-like N-terminal domain-containing protein n=1 Tax=Paraburkholderia tuberum TaxID=157910 RepID=A0A1H1GWJ9_9BURK|nr:DUF1073 domain-containing protein [Paraburkholderia tuberum]SDR17463.1 hypothetical protein SAMN05445850_3122 [Paraburkholderia tuberum]
MKRKAVNTPAIEPRRAPARVRAISVPMQITPDAVALMRAYPGSRKRRTLDVELFKPYEPVAGVLPRKTTGAKIAMDAGFDAQAAMNLGALENIDAALSEGYAFPGFSVLANWTQIPEFRRPAEVYAREMTRKWLTIKAKGDENKSEKIKEIDAEFTRLGMQAVLREAIQQDGFFGRSQIFIDLGDGNDSRGNGELRTELAESNAKIGRGAIKRLTVVEPIWSYPNRYNADDPLDPNFYRPTSWFVMGREIHSSRLMTVVSRPVPDILKPAYAFAGLSLLQMMKPYVENWLRTRQSVSDLIHSFTVWTLETDMGAVLQGGGIDNLLRRLQIFNIGRDNHGINAISSKDGEKFSNVAAPLGGLDKLQAQAQEQQCAPSGLPLVYLTGITPAGLNASSQDEIEVFQDTAAANQEIYSPVIEKVLRLVQLSLFGEIDPNIYFEWNQLKVVTAEQQAAIRKTNAETDVILVGGQIIEPGESRKRIATEEGSPYAGLDLDTELPEPPVVSGGPLGKALRESGTVRPEDEGEELDEEHDDNHRNSAVTT